MDPTLDNDPDPDFPCPVGTPEIEKEIEGEITVGRNLSLPLSMGPKEEEEKGMLWVRDPGVSRRHAMLGRDSEGVWISDLGSTNGTRVNGIPLAPQVRVSLQVGDEVTLGRWTRLSLRSR
ncbi:MAG: FHA domain-containing protein [Myxococcales bacterium]|nr:FHA domain-containing protein [Polyangiaceae bacterium]MDW8250765.1 FHA domain-containing protein [Myxococcales bacterium]